ncbi:blue (type 1) copper domain protein [Methylocella silvestris BL2]|uniref:Blue (Type 1) copper domain protein n=1 Tax=Methylocella silvestris (strain DSM 15510 / CIP 108128 / LMG 27833 / NCIMB 13906 / BL2) TaxID=395965 RepID=B8EQQ3_METSB|nr:cupredoxin family copper-binding protein [Methylocella silvestris]ACK49324.1 blue (type 1) copper domain protein [Methylocella silvestris BL2]
MTLLNAAPMGVALFLNACSGALAAPPSADASIGAEPIYEREVTIEKFAFRPAEITVKAGTVVTWRNLDETPHAIVSDDFKSEMFDADETFSHTYAKLGTFPYVCGVHPAHMKGRVIVTP